MSQENDTFQLIRQQNIDLMKRHVAAELAGDYEAVFAEMTDPPTYYVPAIREELIVGVDPIRAMHASLQYTYPNDLEMNVVSVDATDTLGIIELSVGGTTAIEINGVPAGTRVMHPVCGLFRFKDGKISQERVYSRGVNDGVAAMPPEVSLLGQSA